jgi:hypothetical protein
MRVVYGFDCLPVRPTIKTLNPQHFNKSLATFFFFGLLQQLKIRNFGIFQVVVYKVKSVQALIVPTLLLSMSSSCWRSRAPHSNMKKFNFKFKQLKRFI